MSSSYPYQLYEMAHAALVPARAVSDATHFVFRNPWNPLSNTSVGKNVSAAAELFERMTQYVVRAVQAIKADTETARLQQEFYTASLVPTRSPRA